MMNIRRAIHGWSRLGICLSVMLASSAFAQSTNLKIGYVDAEALLLQAPQTQVVLRTLEDEFAPRQRDLMARQTELQEKQTTLERDREVMGQDERASLERELRDGVRDFQRDEQEFQEDVNLRRNELLAAAQRAVSEQIASYASAQGYDLILQNVVYHSEGVNVTSEILAYLNENVLSSEEAN